MEIVLKILDFVLGGLLEKWREKRRIRRELESLKRKILHVGLLNDYPVELHKLRLFLIENDLAEKPGNREFFGRWLTDPLVISGISTANSIPRDSIPKLIEELDEVRH